MRHGRLLVCLGAFMCFPHITDLSVPRTSDVNVAVAAKPIPVCDYRQKVQRDDGAPDKSVASPGNCSGGGEIVDLVYSAPIGADRTARRGGTVWSLLVGNALAQGTIRSRIRGRP